MEKYKIKQIKTIRKRLDNVKEFDKEVNEALADGWYLVKRYTVPSYNEDTYIMVVAELQRFVEHE